MPMPIIIVCFFRFKWILRHISFDGCVASEERAQRWSHDRLAAIRYFYETVNTNWGRPIVPSQYLTIDETLYNLYTQVSMYLCFHKLLLCSMTTVPPWCLWTTRGFLLK